MKWVICQVVVLGSVLFGLFSCKKPSVEEQMPEPIIITQIMPSQSIVDSDFIIIGTGFNTIASKNIVKIGDIVLTVKAASATTLSVKCPSKSAWDKVSLANADGGSVVETSFRYNIASNPYKQLRLKSYLYGKSDLMEFSYNTAGQLSLKKTLFINPINGLTFTVSQSQYIYNGNGELVKEVNKPTATNIETIIEYLYTDGVLSGDRVYTLNTESSVIANLYTHTYRVAGGQLLEKIRKNASGVEIFSENYDYSIMGGNPQVTKTVNSSSDGVSTETYIQYLSYFEPHALLIPNSLQSTLFLASSASFSDPKFKNYTISLFSPTPSIINNISYNYGGGLSTNAVYNYENK